MKKKWRVVLALIFLTGCCILPGLQVAADTIYDSPYVTFSPDGTGWTVQEGDTEYIQYEEGITVSTGIPSSLPAIKAGEHYYEVRRVGSVPIGKWIVNHKPAQCIHEVHNSADDYLGLTYGRKNCFRYYNSGWIAYCADCGDEIKHMNVYMDKVAAETIDYMECGTGMEYYFLCPYPDCGNLEQGVSVSAHPCKQISANQYKVVYDKNSDSLSGVCKGYMSDSYHMYNNATEYEGNPVTPITRLSGNTYSCTGYEFAGWNTKADGSGRHYGDKAEILNLTTYDYKQDGEAGVVTLYAQWIKSESTLRLDANGGDYLGQEVYTVVRDYGDLYVIDDSIIIPPDGYTVSFETNGGTAVEDITGTQHFESWSKVPPFSGTLEKDIYYFVASNGNVDTIRANYTPDSIILPEATKENASFGGWYYDKEFQRPAGGEGDRFTPTGDVTLYAQWVELRLYSEDNYTDNGGKGAVNLWWCQADNKNKAYKLYQSTDGKSWKQINSASDIGSQLRVAESFAYSGITQTYKIPHTGLYTLTACGAQGANYETYSGGKGGMVSGTFWLTKGDVLTYSIGGQNGTNGGGIGKSYGNGGGRTIVTSAEKGTLLIAGGGGGAGTVDGKPGGSKENLRTDGKSSGESGSAGGGAGYVGGNNGETTSVTQPAELNSSYEFGYTKGVQVFRAPYSGVYLLEVWGAQGGDSGGAINGGRGGYAQGQVSLDAGDIVYVCVGGKGESGALHYDTYYKNWYEATYGEAWDDDEEIPDAPAGYYISDGGYNGGGSTNDHWHSGGGGGATHMAITKVGDGQLKNYSSTTNQANVLIVAGGGGGAAGVEYWYANQWYAYAGGGLEGEGTTVEPAYYDDDWGSLVLKCMGGPEGGKQTRGGYGAYEDDGEFEDDGGRGISWGGDGSFGQGGYSYRAGAGGGGWYGGGGGTDSDGGDQIYGAGGSGYLSSMLIPGTGSMRTGGATAGGNGKAVITLLKINNLSGGGGSNYVNTDKSVNFTSDVGVQKGNGKFTLQSVNVGFLNDMRIDGVAAPDMAAPQKVQTEGINVLTGENAIMMEPVKGSGGTGIKVIWTEPEDCGTTYFHKAESYLTLTGAKLCASNITENTLMTGVFGYYYIVDADSDTEVTESNGLFTDKVSRHAYITLKNETQYLHIAPVDGAGNIGLTSHVPIASASQLEIPWPVHTGPLTIDEGDNVFFSEREGVYYVRCDDVTPITLDFAAYIEGCATPNYQINRNIFESVSEDGSIARNIVETPMYEIAEGIVETEASGLHFTAYGAPMLKSYTYAKTIRRNSNKDIAITNQFLIGPEAHGQRIRVIPGAGVVSNTYNVYSDADEDRENGICLIGDCQAPEISGLDILASVQLIDRSTQSTTVDLSAEDMVSGLRDFYVEIYNIDNAGSRIYPCDENGNISIDITAEEPLFSGDFKVTVTAVDNVGNERIEIHYATEYALESKVERILAPHNPIFKCGESGILTITTWGYIERVEVEFPEELTNLNPELNHTYVYEIPTYRQKEELQFMVPLYTPYGEDYVITVRAYKQDKGLEDNPELSVTAVIGTVLDELRTRLR